MEPKVRYLGEECYKHACNTLLLLCEMCPHSVINILLQKYNKYKLLISTLDVLHSPQQEVQNIFKANHPMDAEITKAKVGITIYVSSCLDDYISPSSTIASETSKVYNNGK